MQNVLNDLKSFRLSGMVNSLNERIIYAQNNKIGFKEFLALLCEDEKSNRRDNNYNRRKSAAKLPALKNLEDFDFSFQPSIDAGIINDLSICNYISAKENIILIGDSGTVVKPILLLD